MSNDRRTLRRPDAGMTICSVHVASTPAAYAHVARCCCGARGAGIGTSPGIHSCSSSRGSTLLYIRAAFSVSPSTMDTTLPTLSSLPPMRTTSTSDRGPMVA